MTSEGTILYGTFLAIVTVGSYVLVQSGLDIFRTIAIGVGFVVLLSFWFGVILPGLME